MRVGEVSFASAAYVARYVVKKVSGERAAQHYVAVDPRNGHVYPIRDEFVVCSTRPGIGYEWYKRFRGDLWPGDFVVCDGKRFPIPKYYLKLLERESPEYHRQVKQDRVREANQPSAKAERTPTRLRVRKEVKESRISTLKREL